MRESSSGCKDDADTLVCSAQPWKKIAEKKHISKHKKWATQQKEKKGIVCTSSNSRILDTFIA
jgi:hypothetical protein